MTGTRLRAAVDAALAGGWEKAHAIVQADEADPTACWIHAVLHRMEGDVGNARYWYRRAGRSDQGDRAPAEELAEIRATIMD